MKTRVRFALVGALISSGVVLSGVSTGSWAAMYVEAEASNAMTNNSLADAEIISAPLFTMPEPANVFPRSGSFTATITGLGGDGDVDFYKFSTIGLLTNSAMFDIDNNGAVVFDSFLSLFNSAGTLIGRADDSSPADPGTIVTADSFLGQITLAPGDYFIAVSEYENFPTALGYPNHCSGGSAGLFRPDGAPVPNGGFAEFGCAIGEATFEENGASVELPYKLEVSLQPVPIPAALPLFLSALSIVALITRRKFQTT